MYIVNHSVVSVLFYGNDLILERDLLATAQLLVLLYCVLQTVASILKGYEHELATYAKVGDLMNAEMAKGLSKSGNKDATVKMLITYVRNLPTGKGMR